MDAEAHADTDGTPVVLLQSVTTLCFNRSGTGEAPNDNFQEFTWLVQGLAFIILKGFQWEPDGPCLKISSGNAAHYQAVETENVNGHPSNYMDS